MTSLINNKDRNILPEIYTDTHLLTWTMNIYLNLQLRKKHELDIKAKRDTSLQDKDDHLFPPIYQIQSITQQS